MCNFNELTQEQQQTLHKLLTDASAKVGGTNFLLSLIEAIRDKKSSALLTKGSQIASNNTIIKWNKVIFKDKIDVLNSLITELRTDGKEEFQLKTEKNDKKRKNILNMAKTLSPVEFSVKPQNINDGDGFTFKVFQTFNDDIVKFDALFIALFICSTELTKKAVKYNS